MKKTLFIFSLFMSLVLLTSCSSTYRVFRASFDEIDYAGNIDLIEVNVSKSGTGLDIMWIQQYNFSQPEEGKEYLITLQHTVQNEFDNGILPYLKIKLDDKVYTLEGNLKEKSGINKISYIRNIYNRGRLYVPVDEAFIRKMAEAKRIRLDYFGSTLEFPDYGYDFLKKYVADVIDGQSNKRTDTTFIP